VSCLPISRCFSATAISGSGGPRASRRQLGKAVADYINPQRFTTSLFGLFAALGLLLAAFGVYGVMRYWVSARISEIGVRLALGARPSDVMCLVLGRASVALLGGVLAGIAGGLALQRFIATELYGVSPADPVVFAAVSILLSAVALERLSSQRIGHREPIRWWR
jgi:putative ABC transport system permease protein